MTPPAAEFQPSGGGSGGRGGGDMFRSWEDLLSRRKGMGCRDLFGGGGGLRLVLKMLP